MQALARRHATVPAALGRPALVEFEYERGGTLASGSLDVADDADRSSQYR